MCYETIICEKKDHICTITLNRPRSLNALTKQLIAEVSQELNEVKNDDDIGAVIITGAPRLDGRPCFCAGDDLKEQSEAPPTTRFEDSGVLERIEELVNPTHTGLQALIHQIQALPKIVIAAIDGVCTAGGLELALSCDIRTVSETAQISDLRMKNLGRVGGGGITALLTLTVGLAWAKEIIITGDTIDGNEACRIGLANHVFPPDKLMDGTRELAGKIADRHPAGVRMCKAAVNYTLNALLEPALRYNYLCRAALRPIIDSKAVAKDFVDKRKPTFSRSK
jgi:enoyl-CoA hydratase